MLVEAELILISTQLGSLMKIWQHKVNKPICILTEQSQKTMSQIPSDMRKVIGQYFHTFDNFITARSFHTDSFIKEVYYATTWNKSTIPSIKEMETEVTRINQARLQLLSYEIDEYVRISGNEVMIGVTREFSESIKNRVLYFLVKEDGLWKFHHIARSVQGSIIDKFQINDQICYLIGEDEWSMLFLTAEGSAEADLQIGHQVYLEGYLEVHDYVPRDWYYRIVRMNLIH